MTNAGWISVKDRLPEVGKQVLLIVYGWEHSIVYIGKLQPGWYKVYLRRGNSCLNIPIVPSDWLIDGWSYFKAPDVRYWMPLPEIPNGLHRYSEKN